MIDAAFLNYNNNHQKQQKQYQHKQHQHQQEEAASAATTAVRLIICCMVAECSIISTSFRYRRNYVTGYAIV